MKDKEKTTYRKIEYHKKESFYLIVRGLEVGLFAGLVSVLYRFLLTNAESILLKGAEFAKSSPLKCVLCFAVLALLGIIVSAVIKWEPMSSGSGIPQVDGEIKGHLSQKWWRVIIAKLIGGTASILGGLSLGREGPSIQLGAMAGKGIAKITKADKTSELRMISCGGGAGLAAAFNAPLAGVMFVLEEIHHTIDKSIICMGIVACICADFVSKIFFGQSNIFSYDTSNVPLKYYWLLILLGIVLGLLGCGYNIIMSKGQDIFKRFSKIPVEIRMIFVFFVGGAVTLLIPQITGGGHQMVEYLLNERPEIKVLIFLLISKFLFSAFSFGSGAPGGIFFPLLILGTYIGAIWANIFIPLLNLDSNLWQEFVVISMAGIFASIVRAPLTGIILVFEMTGNLSSLLPLAVVSLISYATANLIGVNPIYETLLEKILNSNTEKPEFHRQNEKILKTFIIPVGSPINNKRVMDVDWGRHCLVVSIDRGDTSVTPKGETVLNEGDELVILVSQRHFSRDNERLEKIING
ncbi:MAG: ClC family H(+)/Cl(-) exchange transporter [Eubacterium sp.]